MSLPFLSDSSLASRIFVDFLEGLMRPLGKLTLVGGQFVTPTPCVSIWGILGGPNAANCDSHSTIGSRMCHGLLFPISACHLIFSPFPQTCQPVLGSHQVLHSPQDGLVCIIPFVPTTSFTHPSCTGFFYMAGW